MEPVRTKIATVNRRHLEHATATARTALDYFTPDRLWQQPPFFNAIFFRNLLALDQFAPNPRYRRTLESYLEQVWTKAREPGTELFRLGGIGVYDAKTGLGSIDQAAFVQMFALLAWAIGASSGPDVNSILRFARDRRA